MEEFITLNHGAGGKQTSELIDKVFKKHFENPCLTSDDASVLSVGNEKIAFTTDGFIVSPYKFNGGNIGKLSICGTVNDLACMGAEPLYIATAFVIEEGFPISELEEITSYMEKTAAEAGIKFAAGDTKVAGKGQVDKIFITTTGIGRITQRVNLSGANAKPGDKVIVTRDIGRHGSAILIARNEFGIDSDIKSDCAPLWGTVKDMLSVSENIHTIRDSTRGGVGTVLYEIAGQSNAGIVLDEDKIPVDGKVSGLCGMLGLNPLYLACEGTLVVICPPEDADKLIETLHKGKYSENAAVIGEVVSDYPGKVIMNTEIGSQTLLPEPQGELLPRIC